MIPEELEAEVLRLYHAEKWPVRTIAKQLEIHHEAVERVLLQDGIPQPKQDRASAVDLYVPFIQETWGKYPKLTASRLYRMCKERGYHGCIGHFRARTKQYKPVRKVEAYLRLKTLPGEQAQVDWGHFGKVRIGRAERVLMAFVAVLSWSREIFLRFFLGQNTAVFLLGHEEAFMAWGGVPRVILYDNLKSAVLERIGRAFRLNPLLVEYAKHHRFEIRPVSPARGNEKGRVERAIRFIRGSFFAARIWKDLDDLNAQAKVWCETQSKERPWREDPQKTVGTAFLEEKSQLLPLPANPFPVHERMEVRVGKTPYLRFDLNDYSVPFRLVRCVLSVVASPSEVRILHGTEEVARHKRSYDKGIQVEDPTHIEALVEFKRNAGEHQGQQRLLSALPECRDLLKRLGEEGYNLRSAVAQLLRLLDAYGTAKVASAIAETLKNGSATPAAVQKMLEQSCQAKEVLPRSQLELPESVKAVSVRPHDMSLYDDLSQNIQSKPEGGKNAKL